MKKNVLYIDIVYRDKKTKEISCVTKLTTIIYNYNSLKKFKKGVK